MTRERSTPFPAIAGSVLLHAAIVLIGLYVLPWLTMPIKMGQVVPVTLISAKDEGSLKNAAEAPEPASATTPQPTPNASPQTAAPEPAPVPTPKPPPKVAPQPPKPTPAPLKPIPAKPTPTPKVQPTKPEKSLDLDALAASITPRSAGARQSSAAKGPAKPATAVKAQTSNGVGDVASTGALNSMAAELQRIWNPNCDVTGGGDANIGVAFRLASNGRLIGQPESSAENATDPVIKAASDRAKSAVNQAAPYQNLPPQLYGPKITVNFNARQACAQR
ncbi:MAG TPA: energy transducer TonB [Caulobacteraceae bacterium]|jgi:outer membrane biosynthesis protein TonB